MGGVGGDTIGGGGLGTQSAGPYIPRIPKGGHSSDENMPRVGGLLGLGLIGFIGLRV